MKILKAFTLIEILVAMTLTALLSTFSFQGFQLIQQQYRLHNRINQESIDHQHFFTLVHQDLQKAKYIERYRNQLICNNGPEEIWYEIGSDFVCRNHSRNKVVRDTFPIQVDLIQTFFQKNEVTSGLVDACQLKIQLFKEPQNINVTKKYSASDLINYE